MKINSSYGVELLKVNRKTLQPTVDIYRSAVAYFIDVVNKEWISLSELTYQKERMNTVERLTHSTSKRIAKYDFDAKYSKMPCYLRRAAIMSALGAVASYKSNLANWNECPQGKQPTLQYNTNLMPVFYKNNTYERVDDYNIKIKVFVHNDWRYVKVKLLKTDADYINKRWAKDQVSAPVLERRYGKYYLRFTVTDKAALISKPINEQIICSVDLGLNTDAVCSIMKADSTILARRFINLPSEKDSVYHILNRIKKKQQFNRSIKSLWAYATRLNEQHACHVAAAIIDFAKSNNADVVVFEHLNFKGKKNKGNKAQRLSLWRKSHIQDIVTHKAHLLGMRISRVNPKNTSALAYDGSGFLSRSKDNASLAVFTNGKQYNCDLSASYNIGARYFTRELTKTLSVKVRSQVEAKVLDFERRTSHTLNTLRELNAFLSVA